MLSVIVSLVVVEELKECSIESNRKSKHLYLYLYLEEFQVRLWVIDEETKRLQKAYSSGEIHTVLVDKRSQKKKIIQIYN